METRAASGWHCLPGRDVRSGATTGTHATQTLDYLVVIDGSISLLVGNDDVRLESGDVVVLNGARHDWVNRSDAPCVMAAILVSAEP